MPKTSIYISNDLYKKISAISDENDESFSSVISRMASIGLMIEERKKQSSEDANQESKIDVYCQKLTLQMNALLKAMAAKQMGYSDADFDKLRDATLDKYNEICGIKKEEL